MCPNEESMAYKVFLIFQNSIKIINYINKKAMSKLSTSKTSISIPTQLNEEDFNKFVLPHLSMPKRGSKCQIGYHC
jgi:hypothetical protein